jgi:hypothetical protein
MRTYDNGVLKIQCLLFISGTKGGIETAEREHARSQLHDFMVLKIYWNEDRSAVSGFKPDRRWERALENICATSTGTFRD